MKQDWYPDELSQHWTLSAEERELLDSKTSATRLSFALLLKAFQFDCVGCIGTFERTLLCSRYNSGGVDRMARLHLFS
jgi:hypothetical protein